MTRLQGRVALVTGAARRRGIGRGIALELAREGCDVAINDVAAEDEGEELVAELEALGRRSTLYLADVSDRAQVEDLIERIEDDLGPLDIACPNAGVARWEEFAAMSSDHFDTVVGVNLTGAFNVAQLAARRMMPRRTGRIVVTSSVHAQMPFATMPVYGATKRALKSMVSTLALELAPHGINVNHIAPGYVLSALNDESPTVGDHPEAVNEAIPLGRPGDASEMGRAVVYLCSTDGDYVTGTYIQVDGGLVVGKY
jgi:NAD(P)-dependent dehydrogenase (short-subunit alcohol dehydrogenase family)